MDAARTAEDHSGWYQRIRRADALVAVLVGVGDLLLCAYLSLMVIASGISFGAPDERQQAQMDAADHLAEQIYLGWLAGGLLLLILLGLPRSAKAHLVLMVVPLVAFLAYLQAA